MLPVPGDLPLVASISFRLKGPGRFQQAHKFAGYTSRLIPFKALESPVLVRVALCHLELDEKLAIAALQTAAGLAMPCSAVPALGCICVEDIAMAYLNVL